ncbi:uncharacterized protein CLUP02_06554 [Colletotrichum lupini]|uniref:Uncharacterized protein n=1 Tax=Colletotrichum lupini TaxID=145971 RepID=A0A9Q8WES1_9PEZI|nr:uncharacterized protein CLUP02_06554 [Colletotrichum lupini]UQC81068.1 hypothetical protein CLUP02_06554 [Colletotrichum lupini]
MAGQSACWMLRKRPLIAPKMAWTRGRIGVPSRYLEMHIYPKSPPSEPLRSFIGSPFSIHYISSYSPTQTKRVTMNTPPTPLPDSPNSTIFPLAFTPLLVLPTFSPLTSQALSRHHHSLRSPKLLLPAQNSHHTSLSAPARWRLMSGRCLNRATRITVNITEKAFSDVVAFLVVNIVILLRV